MSVKRDGTPTAASRAPRRPPRQKASTGLTEKALCSEVCRARCCSWGFVTLSPQEAQWLPKEAEALGLPQPTIVPVREPEGEPKEYVMHATPCVFLSKSKLCLVYRNRPEHCRAFPDQLREWCPLSMRWYLEAKSSQ